MKMHCIVISTFLLVAVASAECTTADVAEGSFHAQYELATEQPCEASALQGGHDSLEQCLNINLQDTVISYRGDSDFTEHAMCWSDWPEAIKYPSAVVYVESVDEIGLAVMCAAAYDKMACARSGKHGWECASGCDGGGVVVNLQLMDDVTVDISTKTVRAAGGATQGLVSNALYNENLWTALGGVSSVGMGLILGGGRGFHTRLYGMASDQIVEVEYVDWRGRTRIANENLDPDMYWLARGGGGGVFPGIVTVFTLKGWDIADEITRYSFNYEREALPAIYEVWSANQAALDNGVYTVITSWGMTGTTQTHIEMKGYFFGGSINDTISEFSTITDELANRGFDYSLSYDENVNWREALTAEAGPAGTDITNRNQGYGTEQTPGSRAVKLTSAMGYKLITLADGQVLLDGLNDEGIADGPGYSILHTAYGMSGVAQDLASDETAYAHRGAGYLLDWTFQWSGSDVAAEELLLSGRERMVTDITAQLTSEERLLAGKTVGSFFNYQDNDMPHAETPRAQLEAYFDDNLERILDIRCDRDPLGVFGIYELPFECDEHALLEQC